MRTSVMFGAMAFLAIASSASAAVTMHAGEAGFMSKLDTFGVDRYDDLPAISLLAPTIARTAGPFAYTANASLSLFTAGIGRDIFLSTNDRNDSIVLSPTAGLPSAVGGYFFTTDFNGLPETGDLTIIVTDFSGSTTFSLVNTSPAGFFGFTTDSAIVSVQISVLAPQSTVWPTVNDLILGQVPTPGTAALVCIAGMLSARRRRG